LEGYSAKAESQNRLEQSCSTDEKVLPCDRWAAGATIRTPVRANRVSIDVSREENVIVVSGAIKVILSTCGDVKNIVDENPEVEETILLTSR
jgi:hypothetical protein